MTDKFDAATFIDNASKALGLSIDPTYRAGVADYFLMLANFAAQVNEFPLDAETENPAVFIPCSTITQE